MEYTVVFQYVYRDLIRDVNALIREGWRPQGGIAADDNNWFYQAMVR